MLFLNPWLLAGLAGVTIPIILHLIRRNAAKPLDWGAMRFLFDTVAARRKRMEWEDLLLMVTRCLLIALIALAVARPFVPPDSQIPWLFVLPAGLLGMAAFGGSFVLSSAKWKWLMRGTSLALIFAASFLIWQEKNLNLRRFQTSERRDVALVIDGSTSMSLTREGVTAFDRAVSEARSFVKEAPRGTAFSVILGGPAPELVTATPLTHRADVLEVLDQLSPVGGPFRAHEALGMATLTLAEGQGSTKDLVVFTDLQRIGWQLDSTSSWSNLGDAWNGLPEGQKPRLLVRNFQPPEKLRNVAVTGIELSREVVGTDREVAIRVRVQNTGTEVVTPGLMRLSIGGTELEPKGLGQMTPGEDTVIDYRHQFKTPGPRVIKAALDSNDDLAGDDLSERAIWVKKTLPVLIVDGNSGAPFFQRAGGYLGLALAPVGKNEEVFVDPRVINPAALGRETLNKEAVIVLADVPRLPAKIAAHVADFVLNGGGLWVIAGPKVEPAFYQNWLGGDGSVIPATLGEMTAPTDGVRPAPGSFDHPALRIFQDSAGKDLGTGLLEGYRLTSGLVEGAQAAARFTDGGLFLATQNYGSGRILLSTTALDARLGNLPARPSFVPFVHEITNWLAGGQEVDLNVRASWSPTLSLPGGGGLRGRYIDVNSGQELLARTDPTIDFDWGGGPVAKGLPRDNFRIEWSGSLMPPATGDYIFEATVDDEFTLTLGEAEVLRASIPGGSSQKIALVAGKAVLFKATFVEEWGDAHITLQWTRPDGQREVIPATAFLSVNEDQEDQLLGESEATDPLGRARDVTGLQGRRGRLIEVSGAALPGEYKVGVPDSLKSSLSGQSDVPLVVLREPGESLFEPWNDDDRSLIRREIDLIELGSIQDVLAALRGEGFGREIWKILALAALALFFLEMFLARWVSKSRKAGEEIKVDFEKRHEVPEEFLKSVAGMKGGRP